MGADIVQKIPQRNQSVPVIKYVIDDLITRAEFGRSKYGTYLQANNGRDTLMDAYQESLDLCMYLRQAILERDGD